MKHYDAVLDAAHGQAIEKLESVEGLEPKEDRFRRLGDDMFGEAMMYAI